MKKLVRDFIPDMMAKQGKACRCYQANETEYRSRLKEKLLEEVHEFNRDETIEEIADILEVLEALCKMYAYTEEDLQAVRTKKGKERGTFEQRLILEY